MTSPVRTALYRLYDADDVLLYVGVTNNTSVRWSKHAADKPWWPLVVRQDVAWHPDRETALALEKKAIREERPAHNTEHSAPAAPDADDVAWGYQAIAADLAQRIARGEFAAGSPIPTVADLVTGYRVARQTVRSAVGVLVRDGLVETRGRRGTFVRGAVERTVTIPVGDPQAAARAIRAALRPDQVAVLVAELSD